MIAWTANAVYELPFGKGKMLLASSPRWLDQLAGGWQLSGLMRVSSGIPLTIGGSGVFPTNYWQSSLAIPNGTAPKSGLFTDNNKNPSLFSSTAAANSYPDAFPGGTGQRAIVRVPWQRIVNLSLTRNFRMPWENHSLTFRVDAFNVFNFVNFLNDNSGGTNGLSLSLSSPSTFGEFVKAADARVLQLALRYSF